jgi:F-type H+-transporting ATPase subunit delta
MSYAIARPYANAISMLAKTKKDQKEWMTLIDGLVRLVSDAAFENMIHHPAISKDMIHEVVKTALDVKNKHHDNLLKVLIENHRLDSVVALKDVLNKMFLEANGEVEAIVKSAHKLSATLEKKVKAFIMKEFNAKDVELTSKLDSTLVGSLLLEVDGKQIDWTIQNQLNKFKEQF